MPTATTFSPSVTPLASLSNVLDGVLPISRNEQTEIESSQRRFIYGNTESAIGDLDYLPPSSPPPLSPASGWGSEKSFNDEESKDQFQERSSDRCKGQLIEWVAGSVWDTYAYQQHDNDSIRWTPVGYEGTSHILLQSKSCTVLLKSAAELTQGSCRHCHKLLNSKSLLKFMHQASQDTIPHTPWKYLSTWQLRNMLLISRKQENTMKLNVSCSNLYSFLLIWFNHWVYSGIKL